MLSLDLPLKNPSDSKLHIVTGRSYLHKHNTSNSRSHSDLTNDNEYGFKNDLAGFSHRLAKKRHTTEDKTPLKLPKIANHSPAGFGPLSQVFLSPKNQTPKLKNSYGLESPQIRNDLRMFIQGESPKIKEEQKLSMTLYNNMLNKMLSSQGRQSPSTKDIFSNKVAVHNQGYITLKKAREIDYSNKRSFKVNNGPKKGQMSIADAVLSERKKISPIYTDLH